MATKKKKSVSNSVSNSRTTKKVAHPKDKLLPRFTIFFFNRPLLSAILWIILTVFGAVSYTSLLKREGFPSIDIPITIVGGAYFVNDPAQVDAKVAEPIASIALNQPNISTVQTQSGPNFFVVSAQFKQGTNAQQAASELETQVNESGLIPQDANIQYNVPYFGATGGDAQQIDLAISFYAHSNQATTQELSEKATEAAQWLRNQNPTLVKDIFVKSPYDSVINPITGQPTIIEKNFDRLGLRENEEAVFYDSVIIGVAKQNEADVIELDEQISQLVKELQNQPQFEGFGAEISASFAPAIQDNISELQKVLIEGLLAVLVVGSIVIAVRASIITVISMITVLLMSLGLLYIIGYSLNVVTLFALILGLALIVDDTIIMVEAIDAARRRHKDPKRAVAEATQKVSRAMIAATLTACLCFAPLLFAGGVLGSFIQAIPVTIIASLLISLLVALVFIPFFSRFLLLGKKQMGSHGVKEVAATFEIKLASFIARPMLWARNSKKRLFSVGLGAVLIGLAFVVAGVIVGRNVVFNIFPPTKDSNGVSVALRFAPNITIDQAKAIAEKADKIVVNEIGKEFIEASYYATGDTDGVTISVELTPYSKRDVTSVQIVKDLQNSFDETFVDAKASVSQVDVGPPSESFVVEIKADNRQAAFTLANDLALFMQEVELKRANGKIARMVNVNVPNPNQYIRNQSGLVVVVSADFDGTDTSTLVTLAQDALNKEFPSSRVVSYGLPENALTFNLGQESENQDSFQALVIAFPILMFVMYLLLLLEFRSFLQPLLIFLAIPFSLFGIMLGLYLTDNAISFFAMLGFFALAGLSIKNTILLTDYANQARSSGMSPIDASVAALEERFRPLFATSMTAVVSLIPLAITSPFWQGLSVVIIFGLLSSTFLVVTVFPYYYLGAEYLRLNVRARDFWLWLVIVAPLVYWFSTWLGTPELALLVVPLSLAVIWLKKVYQRIMVVG